VERIFSQASTGKSSSIARWSAGPQGALGGSANPNTAYGLYLSAASEQGGAFTAGDVVGGGGNALFRFRSEGDRSDMYQRLASAIPGMILAGLQDADLPKQFKEFFAQFNASGVTQEQLDNLLEIAGAARQMERPSSRSAGRSCS